MGRTKFGYSRIEARGYQIDDVDSTEERRWNRLMEDADRHEKRQGALVSDGQVRFGIVCTVVPPMLVGSSNEWLYWVLYDDGGSNSYTEEEVCQRLICESSANTS